MSALSSLRGSTVRRHGRELGALADVVVGGAGDLVAVLIETDGQAKPIKFDHTLQLAPESRSAA